MRRSVLSYRREDAGTEAGLQVVALHGASATCSQLLPLCRSLPGISAIFVPEGPLPSSGRFGTLGAERDWFVEQGVGSIEPLGFADSLHQVEQFVLDTIDDVRSKGAEEPSLCLLGLGQGGVMALTLSIIWPELLRGVVAIQGNLPEIPGWDPPRREMRGLPVLLVGDTHMSDQPEGPVTRSATRLATLGAHVVLEDVPGAGRLTSRLGTAISRWLQGIETPSASPPPPAG
jgi:predicted esterase